MYKLVLLRHGESVWNKENRFTGWTDVDLSEKGGRRLRKQEGFEGRRLTFDIADDGQAGDRTLWIVLTRWI